ncbi:MAG: AIM24 family protein [Pseudonocardiaceae bacterium]
MLARQGSMVAYQGEIQFKALGSGGIGKFLKQRLTGEGIPLMKASGPGDVFLADDAADVHLIDLEGPQADPQAAIAWSAALQTGSHRADQLGLGTLLGRTTGEAFTMSFAGQGFVVVQPSEELPVGLAGHGGEQSGAGGLLGGLMGR